MKKKTDSSEDQGSKWLTTFNDMVTLLLTFFVLVLSMSSLDTGKVLEVSYSINQAFGMLRSGDRGGVQIFKPFVLPREVRIMHQKKNKKELAEMIGGIAGMDAKVTPEGVHITLGEKILFDTGKAEFSIPNGYVDKLGAILRERSCAIRVEGHTDNVPIHNALYQSNWELSTARAVAVVKYLISECRISPERLSAVGYADSRPRVSNNNESNREHNRRVEIILSINQ